jgi:hypothetical protein
MAAIFRLLLLPLLTACITTAPGSPTRTTPEIAAGLLASEGGFTLTPAGENLARSNLFAVAAYPERGQKYDFRPQAEHIATFSNDNSDVIAKQHHTLGGWCEGKDSTPPCYLDISIVVPSEDAAIAIGKACNQQSVAHLAPVIRFINTGGDGGALQGEALEACQRVRDAFAP